MERMERTERMLKFFPLPLLSHASSALLDLLDPWDLWDPRDLLAPRDHLESLPRMEPPERWEWLDSLDLWDDLEETVCEELLVLKEDSSPFPDPRDLPERQDLRDLLDPRATPVPTDSLTLDPPAPLEILEHPERKEDPDPAEIPVPMETMETRDLAVIVLVSY